MVKKTKWNTSTPKQLQFTGNKQSDNVQVKARGGDDGETETLYNYVPDTELIKAVNLAMLLKMPLLVMGEPGCGKSLLAKAIAYDIHEKDMYQYYREWLIKSGSKAKEGLYEFDNLRRLRDATVPGATNDIINVDKYIQLGPMGEAFLLSDNPEKPVILLIDEIDKADIDFPNDLLNELDRMEFEIREKKLESEEKPQEQSEQDKYPVLVKAKYRPVVVITSNSEKDLPDAFLRRCVFHFIEPLSDDKLRTIIKGRYYNQDGKESELLIDKAISTFIKLRESIKQNLLSLGKNVSTSEFLNWFEALKYYSENINSEDTSVKELVAELQKLNPDNLNQLPFKSLLLKNTNSVIQFNETKPTT